MENNETSYALQAATADPLFLWHLMGALKAHDEDFLEATALDYLETFHADKLEAEEARINNEILLTNPSN